MEIYPANVFSERVSFLGGDGVDAQARIENDITILESEEGSGQTRLPADLVPLFDTATESAADDVLVLTVPGTMLRSDVQLAARLSKLAVIKADFTAMIAHELASPLAAIRTLLAVLETGELLPEEQSQTLATIAAQTDVLQTLVADLESA